MYISKTKGDDSNIAKKITITITTNNFVYRMRSNIFL